jgi:aspartyl-tRNA(Asn)/glutamyl-tRNA(Gln) amidotransferase subunit C
MRQTRQCCYALQKALDRETPRTLNQLIESVRLRRSDTGLLRKAYSRFGMPIWCCVNGARQRFEWERVLMSLSIEDVAKVALLARLRIEPDDLATFTAQINSIVDYVAQLQELDTTDVEPLAHGIELRNVFRDDARGPALDREKALANAPQQNQSSFLVPAVLE